MPIVTRRREGSEITEVKHRKRDGDTCACTVSCRSQGRHKVKLGGSAATKEGIGTSGKPLSYDTSGKSNAELKCQHVNLCHQLSCLLSADTGLNSTPDWGLPYRGLSET
jgi:hypothetical protein